MNEDFILCPGHEMEMIMDVLAFVDSHIRRSIEYDSMALSQ
jgi:hypothetical protein